MQMQMQMRTYTDAIKMQITCTDMCVFNICPLSHIGPLRGGQNTNLTITTEKLMKKGVDLPAKIVGLSEPRGLAEGGGAPLLDSSRRAPSSKQDTAKHIVTTTSAALRRGGQASLHPPWGRRGAALCYGACP